jgi:hypothetical protein
LYDDDEICSVLHRHELPELGDAGLRFEELADRAA